MIAISIVRELFENNLLTEVEYSYVKNKYGNSIEN